MNVLAISAVVSAACANGGHCQTVAMSKKLMMVSATMAVLVLLTACAGSDPVPKSRTVTFTNVTDSTSHEFYTLNSTATGLSDDFGNTLTIGLVISNYNQANVYPTATISFPDGSTVVCVEDDPRRSVALVQTTTEAKLPCDDTFPQSIKGAHVVVTETE